MRKKYLFAVLTVISAISDGWCAKSTLSAPELNAAWGAAWWKTCQNFNIGDDQPCIGASRSSCFSKSVNNPQYPGDEYGILMMVATVANANGAYFCPMMVNAGNKNRKTSVWTEYYSVGDNCVWLCKEGKTGERCTQDASANVVTCDTTLLKRENYDNINPAGGNTRTNIEDQIPNWGANNYVECHGNVDQEHDLILGISNWLPSGHGAFVRPYVVQASRDGWDNMISWIDIYPAASQAEADTTNVSQVLACKNGWKPNASKTDCIPINATICGEVEWCDGWEKANYDELIHTKISVGDCIQWRCKESDKALIAPGASQCEDCARTAFVGVSPKDGTCNVCQTGKVFSSTADSSGFCADAYSISKEALMYGAGDKNSPLEQQCWTIDQIDKYKSCVLGQSGSSLRISPSNLVQKYNFNTLKLKPTDVQTTSKIKLAPKL